MASKGLALPAGTPDEIVQTYYDAVDGVVAHLNAPENQAEVAEIVGPYPQATREHAANVLQGALVFPEEVSTFLNQWISQQTEG
jgi:tripartite-type tricarboxylate transporter receptor subunit TctC